MKIALDAGHGWHEGKGDPGAIGPSGLRESEVTLKVAEMMKSRLTGLGHTVIMTRPGKEFISLAARAKIANAAVAACFVSIHCNAASDPTARGSETWHYTGSEKGKRLASCLQEAVLHYGGLVDRGVKKSSTLAVLRNTLVPAALVELAFISNPVEEQLLANQAWLAGVAKGLALAIDAWGKQR